MKIIAILFFLLWMIYGFNLVKKVNNKYRLLLKKKDINADGFNIEKKKLIKEHFGKIFKGLLVWLFFILLLVFINSKYGDVNNENRPSRYSEK